MIVSEVFVILVGRVITFLSPKVRSKSWYFFELVFRPKLDTFIFMSPSSRMLYLYNGISLEYYNAKVL